MFLVNEFRDMLILKMSTETGLIDRAVARLDDFLDKMEVVSQEGVRIVARELLENAVEHGNRGRVDKEIQFEVVHAGGNSLKVAVEDEGEGFDWALLATPLAKDCQEDKGYPLIKTVTDDFDFNEKGNRVLARINIRDEAALSVSRQGNQTVVRPSGDLTRNLASKLRILLLELFSEDCSSLRFDLSEVKDIDSVIITILLVFGKMCDEKDQKINLEISGANEDIANLFQFTHLDQTYPLVFAA